MKILHFYKSYFPRSYGGVEQVIYQIASATSKCGIQTEVLSLSHSNEQMSLINNHYAHVSNSILEIASTPLSLSVIRKFKNLAAEADIVHYHYPWPFMDMVHFITRLKKPTVVTYHSDIVRQKFLLNIYRPLQYYFLNSVDLIVATSPNYLKTSPILKQYAHKTTVIPIGLDKSSYPIPSSDINKKWLEKFNKPFFLFIGKLRYYKGLHFLLDAVSKTDLQVVIVGTGPMESTLKKQASDLKLKNVCFLGELPEADKVSLLNLCYGVVFPSHLRSEAFGVALLEGAMFGKPMISCEIGTGTSYVNRHLETGLVVPPSNSDALRQAMQSLIDNPCLAATMGEHAYCRYEKYFTGAQMTKSYVDLYQQLLNNNGSIRY
jgi:rhamnosyl/mannosyltransferase